MKRVVDIQHSLHPVVARGHVVQAFRWIAERRCVHDGRSAGSERVDIDPEHLLRLRRHKADLESWLVVVVIRQNKHDVTVESSCVYFFREEDFESCGGGLRGILLAGGMSRY